MSSNNKRSLNETIDLIEECMHSNRIEFLAQLIMKLESEYIEIAKLSTDNNYQSDWTHIQVLDYLTYGQNQ